MKMLAKGTSADCVLKVIKLLLDAQQTDFMSAVQNDTEMLHDIADELDIDKSSLSSNRYAEWAVCKSKFDPFLEHYNEFNRKGKLPKTQITKDNMEKAIPEYVEQEIRQARE